LRSQKLGHGDVLICDDADNDNSAFFCDLSPIDTVHRCLEHNGRLANPRQSRMAANVMKARKFAGVSHTASQCDDGA
jgi:hypothetical protein